MGFKLNNTDWLTWKKYSNTECASFEKSKEIKDEQFVEFDKNEKTALIQGKGKKPYRTSLSACSCPVFDKPFVFSPCKHMFALARRLGYFKGWEFLPKEEEMSRTLWNRYEQVLYRVTSPDVNPVQFGRYQLSTGSFPLIGFNEIIELKANETNKSIDLYFLIGLKYIYLVPLSRSFEIPINGLDCEMQFKSKHLTLGKVYDSDWGSSVAKFSDDATDLIIEALIRGGDCTIELMEGKDVIGSIYLPETTLFANTYASVFLEEDFNGKFETKNKKKELLGTAIEL